MIKKIIKNILLVFVIVYTICSLIGLVLSKIDRVKVLSDALNRIENRTIEAYNELEQGARADIARFGEGFSKNEENDIPVPATYLYMVRQYAIGESSIILLQVGILISSICLSIPIGIIISLEEKSKYKQILIFISIGLILGTIAALLTSVFYGTFFENFFSVISDYGIYYILVYVVIFLTRYFVSKIKIKRLNEELKNKQNNI